MSYLAIESVNLDCEFLADFLFVSFDYAAKGLRIFGCFETSLFNLALKLMGLSLLLRMLLSEDSVLCDELLQILLHSCSDSLEMSDFLLVLYTLTPFWLFPLNFLCNGNLDGGFPGPGVLLADLPLDLLEFPLEGLLLVLPLTAVARELAPQSLVLLLDVPTPLLFLLQLGPEPLRLLPFGQSVPLLRSDLALQPPQLAHCMAEFLRRRVYHRSLGLRLGGVWRQSPKPASERF